MLYLFTFKVKQQMQYMIEAYKKSWQKSSFLGLKIIKDILRFCVQN